MVVEERQVGLLEGPQWDFALDESWCAGLFGGRGSGKSTTQVIKCFLYVNAYPGARGVMTAPTFSMIEQTLLPTIRDVWGSSEGSSWVLKEAKMEIAFPSLSGSVIYLRPAMEPDRFRGLNIAFASMDEIAVGSQHETFMLLQPALRQQGYPQRMWVTSTPHWRANWIRQRWVDHINPQTKEPLNAADYPIYQLLTERNKFLPKHYLKSLMDSYGDTRMARQELYGEFIAVEGAAFPQFVESIHVKEPDGSERWRKKIVGLDFGSVRPTAAVEIGLDEQNRIWVLREFYKRNADTYELVRTMADWETKRVICDPSISEEELKEYRRVYGIPMKRAKSKRFQMRVSLVGARLTLRSDDGQSLRPGMYISPGCPNLIGELQSLAYHKPKGMDISVDQWEPGSLDHAFDALAYALMEFETGPMTRPSAPFSLAGFRELNALRR